MAKSYIHIRVEEDVKQTIEAAARRQGTTLTTFVLDAAIEAANRDPDPPAGSSEGFGGVPKYFEICCHEASRGGGLDYGHPAYHLSIHLETEVPWDSDSDAWSDEIRGLLELVGMDDDEGVWQWFIEHYPDCMELVPRRRWKQFVQGVRSAYEQRRLG